MTSDRARGRSRRAPRRAAALAALLALAMLASACTGDEPGSPPEPDPTSTAEPAREPLSFGVYGSEAERAVWQRQVDAWNAPSTERLVSLVPDFTHDELVEQIALGQVPDVFIADQQDLAVLEGADLIQPVDELLDERGVDFGDTYSRDALQLFSDEDSLQCMPLGISPLVMFVNTELVNFFSMALRGLEVPSSNTLWTFDQFAAAVQFATRPRQGIRGLHVDQSIQGMAPYVLSAGGQLFDEEEEPTQLALSDDEAAAGIERLLQLARAPQVSPSTQQLARVTPEQLFARGRLAVLAGDRSLVPRLRRRSDLAFDVRQIPFLGADATLGDVTGLCISSALEDPGPAADFVVELLRAENVAALTRTGSVVPSNLQVAQSEAFLQPGRQPAHPEAFLGAIRDIQALPPLDYAEVEAAVRPQVLQLFNDPVIDLPVLLEEIDEVSRSVIDPDFALEQEQEQLEEGQGSSDETDGASPDAEPSPDGD